MGNELSNSIIRIVQDFCFKNNIIILVNEFSLSIATKMAEQIEEGRITQRSFDALLNARKDFFIANELELTPFSMKLFNAIRYEIGFCNARNLKDVIIKFKSKMEDGLANAKGFALEDENTLRNALVIAIKNEYFLEAKTSFGNSDVIVPSEKTIIETKIWKGLQNYKDGILELNSYLNAKKYNEGYYVVFDYNIKDNPEIQKHGEVFDHPFEGKLIHVIFVRMKKTPPSQIGKSTRSKKKSSKKTTFLVQETGLEPA